MVGCMEIGHVIVPVEHGFAGILQRLEQQVLDPVEHVESDEDVMFVWELFWAERLAYFPIEHALIGDAVVGQCLPEAVIDVTQHVP